MTIIAERSNRLSFVILYGEGKNVASHCNMNNHLTLEHFMIFALACIILLSGHGDRGLKTKGTGHTEGICFLPRRVNLCQKYWHGLFMSVVRRSVTVAINIWKDFLPTTTTMLLLHQISISSCPSHCGQNIHGRVGKWQGGQILANFEGSLFRNLGGDEPNFRPLGGVNGVFQPFWEE